MSQTDLAQSANVNQGYISEIERDLRNPSRRTIRALGLRRLQHSVEREDSPTIRGMVHKVRHMLAVEEA